MKFRKPNVHIRKEMMHTLFFLFYVSKTLLWKKQSIVCHACMVLAWIVVELPIKLSRSTLNWCIRVSIFCAMLALPFCQRSNRAFQRTFVPAQRFCPSLILIFYSTLLAIVGNLPTENHFKQFT
uniref:Uncharacterized protein n=1 Tax=Cyanoptyche gloeocystis TaxID=77922 RepID=A0A7S2JN66_9EUKA